MSQDAPAAVPPAVKPTLPTSSAEAPHPNPLPAGEGTGKTPLPEGEGTGKTAVQIGDPFQGGAKAEFHFSQKVDHQRVEELLKSALTEIGEIGEKKDVLLEIQNPDYTEGSKVPYADWTVKMALPPAKAREAVNSIDQTLKDTPFFPASNAIGSAVAVSARYQAIYALVASWVLIILYLWIRFQGVAFGLAAVVALIHDVLVMLGAIALSSYIAPYFGWMYIEPFKINLPIIAAFLTIIGYSVNDTIVVFDRIREVRGKDPDLTAKMVNDSTNQTLSRTLLTSLTVFMVVVVLYFFAGQALRGLSFALIVGVITGTYSSIYVAAPILVWLVGKGKILDVNR
jgi:SecD/SecF fusion protein